jgi:nucleoid DNA-binding protein
MTEQNDRLLSALAAIVRDRLIEGHQVGVPGLGTFSVRHVPSKVVTADDGESMMFPPRDEVEFESWSE